MVSEQDLDIDTEDDSPGEEQPPCPSDWVRSNDFAVQWAQALRPNRPPGCVRLLLGFCSRA